MESLSPRFQEVFFELYEALPRQGPGDAASARRALSLCRDLPPSPDVLDLGCGTGAQTLYLAEMLDGRITAIDNHAASVEHLRTKLEEHGLSHRVRALVGDMADAGIPPASIDLIWSEGALYNLGIREALKLCHGLLRPDAHLVFTDAVWTKEDPPPEVRSTFDLDYPTMGTAEDVITSIEETGFELLGHFTLPDEAWWADFYDPMICHIEAMRSTYSDDPEALDILDELALEPEMHRRHSEYYAYEYFVARRS
jgi:SAM-dependent methyltransferase